MNRIFDLLFPVMTKKSQVEVVELKGIHALATGLWQFYFESLS